mmetsp:Transcript_36567/g.82271  ORF Transcript_36567/g.82271 Transcript_36567/m.82271 type:complete len:93 (-) Transcript_36567:397-675(-)
MISSIYHCCLYYFLFISFPPASRHTNFPSFIKFFNSTIKLGFAQLFIHQIMLHAHPFGEALPVLHTGRKLNYFFFENLWRTKSKDKRLPEKI